MMLSYGDTSALYGSSAASPASSYAQPAARNSPPPSSHRRSPSPYGHRDDRRRGDWSPPRRGGRGGYRGGRGGPGRQSGHRKEHEIETWIQERHERERPTRTLFLRNLSFDCLERELRERFGEFGDIRDLFSMISKRGIAFITFYDLRDAMRAKEVLNGVVVAGRELDIHFSLPRETVSPDTPCRESDNQGTVVVTFQDAQAAARVGEEEIKRKMSQYGDICSVSTAQESNPDQRYIEYYDSRSCMRAARALHLREEFGSRLRVEFAWDKAMREAMYLNQQNKERDSYFRQFDRPGRGDFGRGGRGPYRRRSRSPSPRGRYPSSRRDWSPRGSRDYSPPRHRDWSPRRDRPVSPSRDRYASNYDSHGSRAASGISASTASMLLQATGGAPAMPSYGGYPNMTTSTAPATSSLPDLSFLSSLASIPGAKGPTPAPNLMPAQSSTALASYSAPTSMTAANNPYYSALTAYYQQQQAGASAAGMAQYSGAPATASSSTNLMAALASLQQGVAASSSAPPSSTAPVAGYQ